MRNEHEHAFTAEQMWRTVEWLQNGQLDLNEMIQICKKYDSIFCSSHSLRSPLHIFTNSTLSLLELAKVFWAGIRFARIFFKIFEFFPIFQVFFEKSRMYFRLFFYTFYVNSTVSRQID